MCILLAIYIQVVVEYSALYVLLLCNLIHIYSHQMLGMIMNMYVQWVGWIKLLMQKGDGLCDVIA